MILSLFVFLIISPMSLASDFNQFIKESNKNFKEHLLLFDYHISKIGEEDFKNKYLSELAKETFEFKVYQRKKNLMLDETAYDNQLINFNNSLNKLEPPIQFVMRLIQKDVEEVLSNKQFKSLKSYTTIKNRRIPSRVRANLKKIRLLSRWWYFLSEAEPEKITETLKPLIDKSNQRMGQISRLLYEVPKDYEVSFLIDKPKPTAEESTLTTLKKDKEVIEKIKEDLKKDAPPPKKEWSPKPDPSYHSFIGKFLNGPEQKKIIKTEYIPPKNLPKPKNDW